jgi:hypothetical protein
MPNLSYQDCIRHYEDDPEIIKVARAIMGMLPQDEQPIDPEQMVDEIVERGER